MIRVNFELLVKNLRFKLRKWLMVARVLIDVQGR